MCTHIYLPGSRRRSCWLMEYANPASFLIAPPSNQSGDTLALSASRLICWCDAGMRCRQTTSLSLQAPRARVLIDAISTFQIARQAPPEIINNAAATTPNYQCSQPHFNYFTLLPCRRRHTRRSFDFSLALEITLRKCFQIVAKSTFHHELFTKPSFIKEARTYKNLLYIF